MANLKIKLSARSLIGLSSLLLCLSAPFVRYTISGTGILFFVIAFSSVTTVLGYVMIGHLRPDKMQFLFVVISLYIMLSVSIHTNFVFDAIKVQIATALIFMSTLDKKRMSAFWVGSFVIGFYFIYCYSFQYVYFGGGIRRYVVLQDKYLDPNMVSANFLLPSILAIKLIMTDRARWKKVLMSLFLALVIYSSILGGSRGGLISLVLGAVIVIGYEVRTNKRALGMLIVFVIVSLVVLCQLSDLFPKDILQRFTLESVKESGGTGRSTLYTKALSMIKDDTSISHMLFGYGMGTETQYFGKYIHNTFFDFMWGGGIIGIFVYMYVHIAAFLYCIKSKSNVAVAIFVATFVWSMTISLSSQLMYYANTYFAIMVARQNYIENGKQDSYRHDMLRTEMV